MDIRLIRVLMRILACAPGAFGGIMEEAQIRAYQAVYLDRTLVHADGEPRRYETDNYSKGAPMMSIPLMDHQSYCFLPDS